MPHVKEDFYIQNVRGGLRGLADRMQEIASKIYERANQPDPWHLDTEIKDTLRDMEMLNSEMNNIIVSFMDIDKTFFKYKNGKYIFEMNEDI